MRRDLHEENRRSWNAAAAAHDSHKGDQAAFLRDGGSTLAHLQCNAGQDTLSPARLGATVTGVDISAEAVDFARRRSAACGIPAAFHRADVYDRLDEAARGGARFDAAFCSYGAFCWLSDVGAWARGVAGVLKPGGRFVAVDAGLAIEAPGRRFHPPEDLPALPLVFGIAAGLPAREVRKDGR